MRVNRRTNQIAPTGVVLTLPMRSLEKRRLPVPPLSHLSIRQLIGATANAWLLSTSMRVRQSMLEPESAYRG